MPVRLDIAMYLAATPLYESGTFWTAAGVVVAALVFLGGVLLWRFPPPHVIVYGLPTATSLLSTHAPGMEHADIQVTSHGQPVTKPYAVSMRIECRSPFDIKSSDFDRDKPMVFDLNAKIVSPLVINGSDELKDAVRLEGSQIRIEPTIIRRKQYLHVNVLTDGAPKLTTRNEPFQVRLREKTIHRLRWLTVLAVVVTLVGVVGSVLPVHGRAATVDANVVGILLLAGLLGLLFLGAALWPEARRNFKAGRLIDTGTPPARRRSRPTAK
jgi:hypothetical protein